MKQMIILQGPPCSGKSTWAESFMIDHKDENWMLVNRDKIRIEIGNGKYTMDHEDEVTERINQLMNLCSEEGYNIINDNTNLNAHYLCKLVQWAKDNDYEVVYQKFYIPYAEAIKRSKARKESGGIYIPKEVMKHFYIKYYEDEFRKEMTDAKIVDVTTCMREGVGKQNAVIVDLDGTFALHNRREPFEWDRVLTDVSDTRLQHILYSLAKNDTEIIFLTGRPNKARKETQSWLNEHFVITYKDWYDVEPSYQLFMRDDSDHSHGDDYKRNVYQTQIKDKYKVLCAFEDSQKCIDMWRKEGVLCMAVASNDY